MVAEPTWISQSVQKLRNTQWPVAVDYDVIQNEMQKVE